MYQIHSQKQKTNLKKTNSMNEAKERIKAKINFSLFFPQVVCPECNQGWNGTDLTDYVKKFSGIKSFPAGEYVGKSLKTIWEAYQQKTDAEYHLPDDHRLHNKKYIDDSPHSKFPTIKMNPSGYYPNNLGQTNFEHILEEGDIVEFWIVKCLHKKCLRIYLDTQAEKEFSEIFQKAGFQNYTLKAIPNEYRGCRKRNCTVCTAWFLVATQYGVFKIGWRNHVVAITWPEGKNFLSIFGDHHGTKDSSGIHVYGEHNAIACLTRICEELTRVNV
ncbi:MAG: hypothetical protein ACD_80C00113G0026 [uncultured bacterium (gcode 4)]|uniref:Uncharacterized protein n=1 Tax=uncultured bacterium (gcode 4) TaxID=1234023 RepID=K1XXX1_9BACT|nr:MAG: hypothetical protein ACD_80C00113G0026 [uncultured bacterium (gcode 4)]HBB04226.1 hypothetical protein [Candidatus Gracilibacteria bacterium]